MQPGLHIVKTHIDLDYERNFKSRSSDRTATFGIEHCGRCSPASDQPGTIIKTRKWPCATSGERIDWPLPFVWQFDS